MRVIDLSGPITSGMWSYGPPLPEVRIQQVASLHREGWSAYALSLHTLAGTYIETADHLLTDRESVSDLPVDRFISSAQVAHLESKSPLEPITACELALAVEGSLHGRALLVSTGWDRMWGQPGFVQSCPYFLPETMEWVVRQGVRILGVDVPCIQDPRHDDGELNRTFFNAERLLLAPLINVQQIGKGPHTLMALPLNVIGVCGTPCRAIVIEGLEWDSSETTR